MATLHRSTSGMFSYACSHYYLSFATGFEGEGKKAADLRVRVLDDSLRCGSIHNGLSSFLRTIAVLCVGTNCGHSKVLLVQVGDAFDLIVTYWMLWSHHTAQRHNDRQTHSLMQACLMVDALHTLAFVKLWTRSLKIVGPKTSNFAGVWVQ